MSAPYQILQLWLEALSIQANMDYSLADEIQWNLGLSYNVTPHADAVDLYRGKLTVYATPVEGTECPFQSIVAVIAAAAHLSDALQEEQSQNALHVSLPIVLFSTLRGHISSATGSMPHGPYMLPVLSANDLVQLIHGAGEDGAAMLVGDEEE